MPILGDRVYIAPGTKIFASITIGNYVPIGADAVANKSIPHNAVGIPTIILNYNGISDFKIT